VRKLLETLPRPSGFMNNSRNVVVVGSARERGGRKRGRERGG